MPKVKSKYLRRMIELQESEIDNLRNQLEESEERRQDWQEQYNAMVDNFNMKLKESERTAVKLQEEIDSMDESQLKFANERDAERSKHCNDHMQMNKNAQADAKRMGEVLKEALVAVENWKIEGAFVPDMETLSIRIRRALAGDE